ncbi:MAG TPA: hypothetical protein VHM28_00090, partial [Anaerolineales bacterium]|nr:hypothetical protein [Anaerolineales bacterium]
IMGSIVSMVSQVIMESVETRGLALEKYLKKIAGDKTVDLTNLPQIKALRPIRYANWWSVFGSREEKKVEKIPAATLVDGFFDLAGLTGQKDLNADQLTGIISKLPDSEGKQAMLGWINQGVTNINQLKSRTHMYFSGLMDQAAATFKANARALVIAFSILLTALLGTDSIQLARDLWTDAGLRAIAQSQALAATQNGGTPTDLGTLLNQLGALSIRIGWWQTQRLPADAAPFDIAKFALLKLTGLAITAAAVSQGSSFWYDILKKLTGAGSSSSTSAPPSDSGDTQG